MHILPLRNRSVDIVPIARHCLKQIALESGLGPISIDREAEEALERYHWPGNVRELVNVLERVAASLDGNTIHLCDLPFYIHQENTRKTPEQGAVLKSIQGRAEKEAIRAALEQAGYNKAKAARILGIHRSLLYKKMKKYALPL